MPARSYPRPMRALPLLLVLALAGCGSSAPTGGKTDGRSLFAGTCGSCHTLAAAGTSGTFGPDLDDLAPDRARVAAAIQAGPGGMPAKLLAGTRADAVAAYVASAAGN